ncbi:SDR family oxidoreductase [Shinella sp.]|uniref:SDR family oxidoreductase n=1 Tax=Shinella sp. TaxID=1870904 RepID=UPI002896F5FC|nr:SDR family oxidoreductase [Shinella sp.]
MTVMHAIVTGGSSGIGFEIAKLLIERGYDVSLIARDETRLRLAKTSLQRIGRGRVSVVTANVVERDNLGEAIATCEHLLGPCNLLVTSAGIVEPRYLEDSDPQDFEAQMATNFLGTVNAVRAVYTGMKKRRSGSIMMISSAAALIGIPGYTAYCASKAAVRLFAESLRAEALAHGIRVFVSFPPDTHTAQFERERATRPGLARALMGRVAPWSAAAVANRIVDSLRRRRAEVHFGFQLEALACFGSCIKPFLYWRMRKKGQV